MTDTAEGARPADSSRFLPVMLVLFAGSGCSALIYEIVWFQMLSLAIGATAVSIGVLLATFMGGLCLGSYLLPRLFGPGKRDVHPLKLYAYIELGIGLLGLVVLGLIPLIDQFYVAGPQYGALAMVMRAIFCAVAILPPTILMGASLPAIARWAKATPKGVSWWGLFYGINTGGAVVGSLIAGFYLLRLYDIYVATFAAVAINVGVAALSYYLASRIPAASSEEAEPEPAPAKPAGSKAAKAAAEPEPQAPAASPADDNLSRWCVLVAVALSGACSMGAQVVWTRLMGLMLGATVYVFSIILGVFLIGLGIGAAIGSWLARRGPAKVLLGWSQILAAMGLAWTAFQISMSLPDWPVAPLADTEPHIIFQLDLIRCLWALLPATFFWGAAVPLAFAAATRQGEDPGKTVGGVYAANTLGAIAGALLVSLIAIPVLGTQTTQRIIVILSALSGLVALAPVLRGREVGNYALAGLAAAIVAAPTLALGVPKTSDELVAYGRRTAQYNNQYEVLESHEGQNTSIAITRWLSDNSIQFHVAGKVEASDNPYDMRLQRMLGYLPILFHPNPKSVLIVGFGAGVTAGAFMTYPTMDRIVICEMEPKIPPTTTKYFSRQNHNVMNAAKTQIYYDDARHYVLTTKEKFDIITSDPIHPFVKGSASLYSLEYWQMLRDRLNPGGVVTQWIPLYESDFETVKSEIATFFQVFPYATVWANLQEGQGYDLALIGHNQPLTVDGGAVAARLATPAYQAMRQDLIEVGFPDVQSLLDIYSGDKRGLVEWLRGAQINRDSSLRLQYLAGLSLNRQLGDAIYKDMLLHKSEPTGLRILDPPAATPSPASPTVTRVPFIP